MQTIDPRAAVAYLRVSTEEQAMEGVSMDAQRARIEAYCAMRGLLLADVIADPGVSGWKPLAARPGGQRLLEIVKTRSATAVVALKLDRLFRNCADCLTVVAGWDRAGVSLHLVDLGGTAVDTSSAMGRFFLTVMAGAAELERNQVGERTSLALRHMAALGQYTGGHAPFGFKLGDGGNLLADAQEEAALAEARRLHQEGLSLRAVAKVLAEGGFVSRAGRAFGAGQVGRMVFRG